jgi:uncharacterized protein
MSALASGPLDLVALRPQAGTQAFFRHRAIGDKVLITGFEGTWSLLSREEFGPNLHIFVVTLRCNETCVYCHASRADMDRCTPT